MNSTPVPPFSVGNTFEGIVGSEGFFQPGRSVSELAAPGITLPNGEPLQVGDFQPSFVMSFSQELTWNRFRLFGLLDWHRGGTVVNISNFVFDLSGDHTLADTALSDKRAAAFTAGSVYPFLEIGHVRQAARADGELQSADELAQVDGWIGCALLERATCSHGP